MQIWMRFRVSGKYFGGVNVGVRSEGLFERRGGGVRREEIMRRCPASVARKARSGCAMKRETSRWLRPKSVDAFFA